MSSPTAKDLATLEELLTAYAAWQSVPPSDVERRRQHQAEVDRVLDRLDERPAAWSGLKELVGVADDDVVAGVMRYSMERSEGQMRDLSRALEAGPDRDPPSPLPRKSRRRSRDR